MSVTTMLFGVHKEKPIRDLPDDYLVWVASLPNLRNPLKDPIEAEVKRRGLNKKQDGNGAGKAAPAVCPSPEISMDIISFGERGVNRDPTYGVASDPKLAALVADSAAWLRRKIGESR